MQTWITRTERGDNVYIYEYDEGESEYTEIRIRESIEENEPLVVECFDGEEQVERFVFEIEQRQFTGVTPQFVDFDSIPNDVLKTLNGSTYTAVTEEMEYYG
jgi:hypothetical protein